MSATYAATGRALRFLGAWATRQIDEAIRAAIGLGATLAVVVSYNQHQHIGLALLHGLCSWFYVGWVLLTGGRA